MTTLPPPFPTPDAATAIARYTLTNPGGGFTSSYEGDPLRRIELAVTVEKFDSSTEEPAWTEYLEVAAYPGGVTGMKVGRKGLAPAGTGLTRDEFLRAAVAELRGRRA